MHRAWLIPVGAFSRRVGKYNDAPSLCRQRNCRMLKGNIKVSYEILRQLKLDIENDKTIHKDYSIAYGEIFS